MGEEGCSALYVVPGECVHVHGHVCIKERLCGFQGALSKVASYPTENEPGSCQRVPADSEVVCPTGAGTAVMKRLGLGLQRRLHSLRLANPA